ncbi:hypothetical protein Tco_1559959 [Tanacetum coccineum]
MAQFWHTLKEGGSKYRLRFMLDKKELSLTLDDFRTIFHLPQANDNNHNSFVPQPTFSDMVPFYKQQLGFTMELKTSSSFKTTGLRQPWQTLCKIFSKYLTTRVTGWDQPLLQIMQMMYCFVNNIHVDYAELLWEGIYYSLHHPTSSIPQKTKEEMERMITKAILQERGNIQAEISLQIQKAIDNQIPSQVDASVPQTTCRPSAVHPRDQDDPHDIPYPEGENRAKRQKTSEYEAYMFGESSSGKVNENEQGLSTSGN